MSANSSRRVAETTGMDVTKKWKNLRDEYVCLRKKKKDYYKEWGTQEGKKFQYFICFLGTMCKNGDMTEGQKHVKSTPLKHQQIHQQPKWHSSTAASVPVEAHFCFLKAGTRGQPCFCGLNMRRASASGL